MNQLDASNQAVKDAGAIAPEYRQAGWHLSIYDGTKTVGLWSSWLRNRFQLGYPNDTALSDETIMQTLGISYAKPVRQVDEIIVTDPKNPLFKDSDKPLETDEKSRTLEYQDRGQRLWAKFYGPRLPDRGGRVWIDKSSDDRCGNGFPAVNKRGDLAKVQLGYPNEIVISTYPYSGCNKYAPEGPADKPQDIQAYRTAFIQLAVEAALKSMQPESVAVRYDMLALMPEDLKTRGYSGAEWIRGSPDRTFGRGSELVRAEKEGGTIFLESANSIVPWVTTKNMKIPRSAQNKDGLLKLIDGMFLV